MKYDRALITYISTSHLKSTFVCLLTLRACYSAGWRSTSLSGLPYDAAPFYSSQFTTICYCSSIYYTLIGCCMLKLVLFAVQISSSFKHRVCLSFALSLSLSLFFFQSFSILAVWVLTTSFSSLMTRASKLFCKASNTGRGRLS